MQDAGVQGVWGSGSFTVEGLGMRALPMPGIKPVKEPSFAICKTGFGFYGSRFWGVRVHSSGFRVGGFRVIA